VSEPVPTRKVLLYAVDPSTGKTYPVRALVQADGTVLLPASLERDSVGVATESTLLAIKSKTDNLTFDEMGRLYVANPPNLDRPLSDILGFGTQTKRSLSDVYSNISSLISSLEDYKLRSLAEEGLRCYSIEIPVNEVFAVPSGRVWYVREVLARGDLYADGDVKAV
jgi:hypothetical protein